MSVSKKLPLKKVGRPRRTADTPLTRRQQLFVKHLVSHDGTCTLLEAAIAAGFAPRSAHVRATEMKKMVNVRKAIDDFRAELDRKFSVNYSNHVRALAKIRDASFAAGNFASAASAEKYRGQAAGLYVSKSELRIGSIDTMSKADVLSALSALEGPDSGDSATPSLTAQVVGEEVLEAELVGESVLEAELVGEEVKN